MTGPKCLAMISSFSSFLTFTSLGMFFQFSFSVPTQSVECSIYSFLANSGLLKLSIHRVRPRPNKGSKSSSTTAAVLGVSGVIRLVCRTMFLPVYTRKHHTDSHSSKIFIPSQQLNEAAQIPAITEHTYVDSYTKWKAELFSAYLQKELTHDISVDFKPAADMKSMQHPSRWREKYFKLQNTV